VTGILRDNEIKELLTKIKPLPKNWQGKFQTKRESGFQHEECCFQVIGERGNIFRIILRRNIINTFDFSIILTFHVKMERNIG